MEAKKVKPKVKPKGAKLDDYGGETITVSITRNSNLILKRSASITIEENGKHRYVLDNGEIISHKRDLGILKLVKEILKL